LYPAYKADFSPAQMVLVAALEFGRERPISLCLSGINYGENVGSGITISGTVGAALEAACLNIPAMAVSLETPKEFHFQYGQVDFSVAGHFARYFAQQVLAHGLPPDVDVLKIDVPASATPATPWQPTSVSRQRYYHLVSQRNQNNDQVIDYEVNIQSDTLEPGSDIYVFAVEKLVSVTPLTVDLTAKVGLENMAKFFNGTS